MKIHFILFYLISIIAVSTYTMSDIEMKDIQKRKVYTKNWVPIKLPSGDITWKGTDNEELVIIYKKRYGQQSTGKRMYHSNPRQEVPLTPKEVADYLQEIQPELQVPKINLRDL